MSVSKNTVYVRVIEKGPKGDSGLSTIEAQQAAAEAVAAKDVIVATGAAVKESELVIVGAANTIAANANIAVEKAGEATQAAEEVAATKLEVESAANTVITNKNIVVGAVSDAEGLITQIATDKTQLTEDRELILQTKTEILADKQIVVDAKDAVVADVATAVASAQIATDKAAIAEDRATVVTNLANAFGDVSGVVAQTSAAVAQANLAVTNAVAAKDQALAASNAALIQSGVYETEALGRAAVANGVAFKVQGTGDVAAYEYRRTSASASVLIGSYPSAKVVSDITTMIYSKPEEDLLSLVDENGGIVMRVSEDGGLHLTGLENSIQDTLTNLSSSATVSEGVAGVSQNDLLVMVDPFENVVMRLDGRGDFHLPKINGGIQDAVLRNGPQFSNGVRRTPKHFFSKETNDYVAALTASANGMAPVPLNLMPGVYTVPNSFVNSFSLTLPTERLSIDTPYYKDDKVVHPYLIEFYNTFLGYRYLFTINPYTVEPHENPVVYGSNDLKKFDMLEGFQQPLDTPPPGGFSSDTGLTYDPTTGELICFWRITRRPDDGLVWTSYWHSKTKDGRNWTPKHKFFDDVENEVDGLTSPAFLFDPKRDIWHMWNVSIAGKVSHRTAPTLDGPWTARADLPSVGATIPWHIEVKWVGDKMVMLINKRDPDSNFFFAISEDGENWQFGETPLFATPQEALYKATFVPVIDDTGIYLDILWTTNHSPDPDKIRRLYHAQTNKITL